MLIKNSVNNLSNHVSGNGNQNESSKSIRLAVTLVFSAFFFMMALQTIQAATFTVTKTADTNDGVCNADCSLREAIAAANTAASDDVIEFDPMVFNAAQTIIPA